MFRTTKLYTCMAVVLAVICVIFLSNCGGGGNSSVVPNTNPTTENPVSYTNLTPTPVLIQKPIQGYIYANNITTEDGENVPCINVLDVLACQEDSSGNQPFVTQVANSLKEDYPEDWVKPEVQELYAQLNKTLSESKPLPEYNAQAQLCSAYDDTSIPVGSDGHFDNTVLTGASDSNVKLEVALGEDNYAEVETLPSSGSINSSDATSAAVLKSCPEKIFAFPGEILIFKVYAEPGINLKSAGLKFTLNNSSIGCITQPVYLCLFGAHKYQVAYGCVYMKPGLDTPVDTTITAKLNSGQSMSIFLEVIKKTASVSGTIYTGGSTLVKGYVKSLGPKACSKIDSSGQYSLPKVFMGHSRSVIATWWTSENGQKVRHREEKVIDFLSGDVTGFNFGVPPTPTPTPTPRAPYDEFYNKKVSTVLYQYNQWEAELGKLEANQRIIKWLNGQLSDSPPIPDEIAGATSIGNPYDIWVTFKDGMSACISTSDPIIIEDPNTSDPLDEREEIKPISLLTASSNNTTVKNADVIILSPYYWESILGYRVEDEIKNKLIANNYNVKSIITYKDMTVANIPDDINFDWNNPIKDDLVSQDPDRPLINCYIASKGNWDNIVSPWEIETIGKYGIIYIFAHGSPIDVDENEFNPDYPGTTSFKMSCTIDVKSSLGLPSKIDTWVLYNTLMNYNPHTGEINNPGWWFYRYRKIDYFDRHGWVKELALTNKYFTHLNAKPATNFAGSLIYWCGCCSWHMKDSFNSARAYVGYDRFSNAKWDLPMAAYFFEFMMYGTKNCHKKVDGRLGIPYAPVPEGTPSFDEDKPMDATEALNVLTNYYKVNPDPNPYTGSGDNCPYGCTAKKWQNDPNEHIYFPVPVTVTIEKK